MRALELKVPPVALVVLLAAAMAGLARVAPALTWQLPGAAGVAASLAVLGVAVAVAGVLAFRRAGTTVNPTRPEDSSAVVTTGVYRFSRNPMYLGMLLALVGWAVWLAHPLALLGPPVFVLWMNRFQIAPEERALASHFGLAYTRYCARVARWL
ncbi:isoprenylcysteine carboxylmethyltransferase family protein [Ramlibacter sp. AN1015]|uniref:methyltransferase family protein n=1 Tax=Ramlibacter sp. AN1015 TaxID=3133428 RepID=UPI0030BADB24